ncbi:hypothetical protein [Methylobacterium sp. DCY52]|uniref:hypothetical protein n=1 Tax=Methylobacterium sp. DCY52 TaxID=739139 RepID=UPI003144E200
MSQRAQTLQDFLTSSASALAGLPAADFVERWRLITGEPPAILLSSRTAMLALRIECAPVVPLEPLVPSSDAPRAGPSTAR